MRFQVSTISLALLSLVLIQGCAALHPIHGIPVEQIVTEAESRTNKATIDLSLLVQGKPDQYRVGPKDVLSVYVPGVLGRLTDRDDEIGEAPPINLPQNPADKPTLGFPLTVRGDGTLPLPQTKPIYVSGMTLAEVEDAILRAYTIDSQVLNRDRARVLVSVARPREYEVLVVRQEKSADVTQTATAGVVNVGRARRGTARTVRLPAYQNDVLHALAREQGVDGLPGLDAENTIYIIRRRRRGEAWPSAATSCSLSDSTAAPLPEMTPTPMPQASPVPVPGYSERYGSPQSGSPMNAPIVHPAPYTDSPQYQHAPTLAPPLHPQSAPNMAPVPGHSHGVSSPFSSRRSLAPQVSPASYNSRGFQPLPAAHPCVIRGQSPGRSSFMPGHGAMMPGAPVPHYGHAIPPMTGHAMADCHVDDDWSWQQALNDFDPTVENPHVIKIPIRLAPGERPNFSEEDITLEDGDIVFIESRDTEVFYTAGLLGGGQWELPRDYDLRLLEAIAIAQGPQNIQNTGNANGRTAINGDVTVSGSRVVIMRTLPGGARVPIETSVYKAIRCPDEHNIKIQPGDMIYMQYTCVEGILAFFERNLLETALFGFAAGFATQENN